MAYLQLEMVIRSFVRRILWILKRPFEAVGAEDMVSRRRGWIRAGRIRLIIAPGGPAVIRLRVWICVGVRVPTVLTRRRLGPGRLYCPKTG